MQIRQSILCLHILVRLLEIQYRSTKTLTIGNSEAKVGKVSRGPYKRDERVVKDEELLKKLRAHTGRIEDFNYERIEEQQQLLDKFKEGNECNFLCML